MMAKLILTKDSSVVYGKLFKIAKDQNHIDNNADWSQDDYDIVEVSQSDFDAVRLSLKSVNYDGTNVTYEDITYDGYDIEHNEDKNHILVGINSWLENNSSKPFASSVTNYRDYLNSLDVSSIPASEPLEKWINDQGQEVINLLELL